MKVSHIQILNVTNYLFQKVKKEFLLYFSTNVKNCVLMLERV